MDNFIGNAITVLLLVSITLLLATTSCKFYNNNISMCKIIMFSILWVTDMAIWWALVLGLKPMRKFAESIGSILLS